MIKAVIFDLDGTIAETIDDIADALNSMLKDNGFPLVTREQTISYINNGAFELVKRSLPEEYKSDEEFVKKRLNEFQNHYAECYMNRTYPFEGVIPTLVEIAKRKPIAVLSNKPDVFVQDIIKKLYPENLFKIVIGHGPFPRKPDPTSALYICEKLGIAPNECAIVGDSNVDMLTAKATGLHAVGVTWGYRSREVLLEHGAELIIEEPADLVKIIDYDFATK